MQFRYVRYVPKDNSVLQLDRQTFDKMLFNETILDVRHRSITRDRDMIIYEMLKYNIYDDSTELFYLYVDRVL